VGNGRLAAMTFGDVRREHVQLNEDTVWSGEKRAIMDRGRIVAIVSPAPRNYLP
jgi:hypothetical protein